MNNKENIENNLPLVSVVCNAYNHEKYIKQCLDGIVMQKTNFLIEILIHDDASTDKTAEIIREYEFNHPNLFKPIYQTENQFSQGKRVTSGIQYPRAKGKYIALCEGDDHWIDPLKLQKQVDFLEANPDYSFCFHAYNELDDRTQQTKPIFRNNLVSRDFQMPEIIMGGGGLIGTATIVLRSVYVKKLPDFCFISPAGDYPLVLYLRCNGKAYYSNEVMSNYRVNNVNSEMGRVKTNDYSYVMSRYGAFAKMLYSFDNFTDGKYRKWNRAKASELIFSNFRRRRLDAPIKVRYIELKKWSKYLTFKDLLLSLFLLIPIPASQKQLIDLKNKIIKK